MFHIIDFFLTILFLYKDLIIEIDYHLVNVIEINTIF